MKKFELKLVTLLALLGLSVAIYTSAPNVEVGKPKLTDRYEMAEPFSSGALLSYSSLEASPNES